MKSDVRVFSEVAVLVGVAVVLDLVFGILSKGIFPWGGSISPAMLPIFLIAYRRGVKTGLFAGFIFAVIQLMISAIISAGIIATIPESPYVGPSWLKLILVFLLDYIFPFTLLGLAGLFKNAINKLKPFFLGMILASIIRLVFHIISGVLIFGSYSEWFNSEFGTNFGPLLYSVVYNSPYMLASLAFCMFIGYIMFVRNLVSLNLETNH